MRCPAFGSLHLTDAASASQRMTGVSYTNGKSDTPPPGSRVGGPGPARWRVGRVGRQCYEASGSAGSEHGGGGCDASGRVGSGISFLSLQKEYSFPASDRSPETMPLSRRMPSHKRVA